MRDAKGAALPTGRRPGSWGRALTRGGAKGGFSGVEPALGRGWRARAARAPPPSAAPEVAAPLGEASGWQVAIRGAACCAF